MHLIAGFTLFILGFAMLVGGVALLVGGDIVFASGKKIPRRVGRKTAVVLLAFFPLVFAGRYLLTLVDPERAVPAAAVNWPLALTTLGLALTFLLRGMESKPRRIVVAPSTAPADDAPGTAALTFDGPAATSPKSASQPRQRRGKPTRSAGDPFDFS